MNTIKEFYRRLFSSKAVFLFLLVYIIVLFRIFFIPATDVFYRANNYGDGFSDINTLSAVSYFHDKGMSESALRPVHRYSPEEGKTGKLYTHYPAFPDVLWGAVSRITGVTSEVILRLFPLLFSLLMLPLIFKVGKTYLKDPEKAFWATVFIMTSSSFVFWADNLHKHLQEAFIMWSSLLLFYQFYNSKESKKVYYLLAPFFCVWVSNSSFESIVYFAFLTVSFSLIYEKGVKKILAPINIYLGALIIFGFILHMYLNSVALGGWETAIEDMRKALSERTGEAEGLSYLPLVFDNFFQYFNRAIRYFHVDGWVLLVLFVFSVKEQFVKNKTHAYLMLGIFVSCLAWGFVMPQHASVHHFTAKHLAPVYLLMVPYVFNWLKESWHKVKSKDTAIFKRLALGVVLFYLGLMFISQSIAPTFWTRNFAFLVN